MKWSSATCELASADLKVEIGAIPLWSLKCSLEKLIIKNKVVTCRQTLFKDTLNCFWGFFFKEEKDVAALTSSMRDYKRFKMRKEKNLDARGIQNSLQNLSELLSMV